jgi:hypothetical protein
MFNKPPVRLDLGASLTKNQCRVVCFNYKSKSRFYFHQMNGLINPVAVSIFCFFLFIEVINDGHLYLQERHPFTSYTEPAVQQFVETFKANLKVGLVNIEVIDCWPLPQPKKKATNR